MASQIKNPKSTEVLNRKTEACKDMLVNKEAEACRDMAEEFFRQKNIDFALCAIGRAGSKNPNLPGLNGYFASYMVNKLAAETKSWYAVLGVKNNQAAGMDEIKKRYDLLSSLLHPDKCSSVAAESAYKLVNEAWEVLSDARRREAYNMLMGYIRGHDQSENQFSSVGSSNSSSEGSSSNRCHTKKVLVIRRNGQHSNKTLMDIIRRKRPVEVVKNDHALDALLVARRKKSYHMLMGYNRGDDESKNQTSENRCPDGVGVRAPPVEVDKEVIDLNFESRYEERQP